MTYWMITGASGLLGHHFCGFLSAKGATVTGLSYRHAIDLPGVTEHRIDIRDDDALGDYLVAEKPDYLLHAAAMTNVDECERNPDDAYDYHVRVSENIARQCATHAIKLIYISTDQLWGDDTPCKTEATPVSPVNVYGQTKADGEKVILDHCPDALIARTNFFGKGRPWRASFSDWIANQLKSGAPINGYSDIFYTPIALPFLSQALFDLAGQNASGIFHVAGSERISKYDFIMAYADLAGYDPALITKTISTDAAKAAKRPKDMSLSTDKVVKILGYNMPDVAESIKAILD